MPLNLEVVDIQEVPRQERTSKWRELLEAFDASGQAAARVTFEGEVGRDDKPISASSAASGLSTAKTNSEGRFDHIRVKTRGDAVYLTRKDADASPESEDNGSGESDQG